MSRFRLIPLLTILDGKLVKTTKYKSPQYVGDPLNAVKIFNEKKIDELIVIDIGASRASREPNYQLIENLAAECFMPLVYGGGVKTMAAAQSIFNCGVEKISMQGPLFCGDQLLGELISRYGSQSLVASVDVKKNFLGQYYPYCSALKKLLKINLEKFLVEIQQWGVGEILLSAVDCEGLLKGPDLELITRCANVIDVPFIANGGASGLKDAELMVAAGCDAVAAGAMFVFHGPHRSVLISYPDRNERREVSGGNGA